VPTPGGVVEIHAEVGSPAGWPRARNVLLSGLVAAIVLLATTGAAHATCYSSTPNNETFSDALGDSGNAPDIGNTVVELNATCGISVNPAVTGLNSSDKAVFTYIDTDGDAATGDPNFGAEVIVGVFGDSTAPSPPVLARWNGSTFDFSKGELLSPLGTAGFVSDLNQLAVPDSTTIALIVASSYEPPAPATPEADFAPEADAFYFETDFSTSPAQPPPPAPSAAVLKAGCEVPHVKSRSVAKAKRALMKAGCKYKITGKGKVVSISPKAGTLTTGTVQVKAKAKNKRKRHIRRT